MKLLAVVGAMVAGGLMAFPVVFASGDAPTPTATGCLPVAADPATSGDLDRILETIRARESDGNYLARAVGSTASGAYQFIDGTWADYEGYAHAWLAPPWVQDAKAAEHVLGILEGNNNDVTAVPVAWYVGYVPAVGDPAWDTVPGIGNRLTPRQYQTEWLEEYERISGQQPTSPSGTSDPTTDTSDVCPSGVTGAGAETGTVLDGGWAYPASVALFGTAPTNNPHHDYPAWDWSIPEGTAIFAIRGGDVVSVSTWAYNWFEHPCGSGEECSKCGVGVTIVDDEGTQWTYCHGSQVHVGVGDTVAAGSQILASGNTGRSTGPHLHLAIRTSDGLSRCPQPLLQALRDRGAGAAPADLPTSGCTY